MAEVPQTETRKLAAIMFTEHRRLQSSDGGE